VKVIQWKNKYAIIAKMAMAAIIWAKKTRLVKYWRKLIEKFYLSKDIKKIRFALRFLDTPFSCFEALRC
jgi:hypothetical protein